MKPIKTSFLFFCSIVFITSQFSFAQKKSDSLQYYSEVALQPQSADDLFKAQSYFNINYEKAIQMKYIGRAAYYLYFLSSIEYKKGEYDNSEETAVKALKLLDKMDASDYTKDTRKSLYNLLGLMYTEQKNKPKAIDLYYRALKISKTTSDSANIYNNLSLVYKNFNDVDNAKKEILKAYKIIPRIKDTLTQALVLDNYGVIESKLNNANGLLLMDRALELRISINDTSTIYTSYSHLSEYYYKIDSLKKSKGYALKALELAEIINSTSYKNDALGLLTKLSEDDFAKAYKKLNDSIYNTEKESVNKSELLKYDLSEYKRKLLENQLEKERQESRAIIATSIASFITILSIFLYFILKSKHKKDKIKQAYIKETELSKKVHDELANDMSDLMNFIENDIEVTGTKKSLLLDNIEDIYVRTRDISTETGSIDLINFSDSIKHLMMQHNKQGTKVVTNNINIIDWQNVAEHKKVVIYRCLQELLVNMKKHSKAKVVSIVFKNSNKKKEIRYVDNGIGFDKGKSKLNGLLNVESRIKGIGGNFNFTTSKGNGFKASLEFNS